MVRNFVLTCSCLYFLFFSSLSLIATNYYVSPSGDDTDVGTSPSQAWKTLTKVSGSMSGFTEGDSILFERGGVYRGFLQVYVSGGRNGAIVFAAYGTGDRPHLKASIPLTSWTSLGGGIFKAPCPTCPTRVNNLFLDEVTQPIGRYPNLNAPNRGYLTIDQATGKTQLQDNSLTFPDQYWTGAEVAIRNLRWILDRSKITDFQQQTLTLATPTTDDIHPGYGYFFQNHPSTFDLPGEWSFDDQTMEVYLYLPGGNPNTHSVEVSGISKNISTSTLSDVHFHHLKLTGSQDAAIETIQSDHLVFNDMVIYGAGKDGITLNGCDDVVFTNNLLENINNNGLVHNHGHNGMFRYNTFKKIGMIAGMGANGNGTHTAIWFKGDHNRIFNNRIDSVGYVGIRFEGNVDTLRHNFITHACLTLDDGSAIYTWNDGVFATIGNTIEENTILYIQGTGAGTPEPYKRVAEGIYIDDRSNKVDLRKNTIGWCSDNSILIHNSQIVYIRENTLFGAGANELFLLDDLIAGPNYPIQYVRADSNIFVSTNGLTPSLHLRTSQNNLATFGIYNYNQFCNPFDSLMFKRAWNRDYPVAGPLTEERLTFPEYKAKTGQDLLSARTPVSYPEYWVIDTLSPERITNTTFDNDVAGWNCWGNFNNNCTLTQNPNRLDQGALELGFSTTNNSSYVEAYNFLGQIDSGKTYLLTFSGECLGAESRIEITLQKDGPPYGYVVPPIRFPLEGIRKEYQYFFIPRVSESQSRLTVRILEEAQKLWLDNVSITEVAIDTLRDQYMDLLYNPEATPKTFTLTKGYVDPKGNSLCGSVQVAPYSSVVIMDVLDLPGNSIFTGANVLIQTPKILGCDWHHIVTPGDQKALVSVHPNGQDLGFIDLTTYVNSGPIRSSNGLFVFDRNFAATSTTTPSGPFSIRLYITQEEIDQYKIVNPHVKDVRDLGITHYSSTNPSTINGHFGDNLQGTIDFFPPEQITFLPYKNGFYLEIALNELGEFWISDMPIAPGASFPVDWLQFEAEATSDRTTILTWTTASEENSSHFEIQRSINPGFWEKAAVVSAAGNSQSIQTYEYTDHLGAPFSGTLYYRLKEVNLNGDFTYSEVKAVVFGHQEEIYFSLSPNPADGELSMTWYLPENRPVQIQVLNAMGQPIWMKQMQEFRQSYNLNVAEWPAGIYFVRFITAGKTIVERVVVR